MAYHCEILFDRPLRAGMHRDVADLVAFALDAKIYDALTRLAVPPAAYEAPRAPGSAIGARRSSNEAFLPLWVVYRSWLPQDAS